MEKSNQWEDLRRQAKKIENEIDSKLLSLSKLGSRNVNVYDRRDTSPDTEPLIEQGSKMFNSISDEIEDLISKLTDINNRMFNFSTEISNPSSMYTIQRHREILNDYINEFRKTKNNINVIQIEREELLGPTNIQKEEKTRTDLYLKEREHLVSSENMVDEQINVAIRTRENLMNQRNAMKAIKTQMTTLANRFPIINSLIHRINIKRKKDSMILGSVIGVCLFLLLLYIF